MPLVREYDAVLRSTLKAKPHLRPCLKSCQHCRISFLTHPRNAQRGNMRCPFGCREVQRREAAIRRSVEYYRDEKGKRKKRDINGRRRTGGSPRKPRQDPSADPAKSPERILAHVGMVVSLIEGRPVKRREVRKMVAQFLRQHRMGRRRKIRHRVVCFNEHAP